MTTRKSHDIERTCFDGRELSKDELRQRPFSFADLEGKPEPESWGPLYPKTLGADVEKWRKLDKKRDLSDDEKRAWGAAVGAAIRKLNRPSRYADVPIGCTVQNTCLDSKGKLLDTTAEGEERRYAAYVDRLNAERLARRAADPQWLNKRIVQAFEREFEGEYRGDKPYRALSLPRKPSKRQHVQRLRKAA
jgi:hypothetical protein